MGGGRSAEILTNKTMFFRLFLCAGKGAGNCVVGDRLQWEVLINASFRFFFLFNSFHELVSFLASGLVLAKIVSEVRKALALM